MNLQTTTSLLPPGFHALMHKVTASVKQAKPEKKKRKTILSDVDRALALGKAPPLLVFQSEVNYTYNAHAARLHKLWAAGDVAGLQSYPAAGKNTYGRALAKYRDLLVSHLSKGA